MSRNIVVCCDGMANQQAHGKTNVIKLYSVLADDPTRQVVFYQTGGAATAGWRHKVAMWASIAVGYGLKRDIAAACAFIVNTYREGDRLFLFGFSRGACTVRAVTSRLHESGLCKPHFVGVWETVSKVGWIGRRQNSSDAGDSSDIAVVRHALALDERRRLFEPSLWAGPKDLKQVWFLGDHCDVGGGYPESEGGLSKISLAWMLDEAQSAGLLVEDKRKQAVLAAGAKADPNAPMHDPLATQLIWRLLEPYGGRTRRLPEGALLHVSVYRRQGYARQLPEKYAVEASEAAERGDTRRPPPSGPPPSSPPPFRSREMRPPAGQPHRARDQPSPAGPQARPLSMAEMRERRGAATRSGEHESQVLQAAPSSFFLGPTLGLLGGLAAAVGILWVFRNDLASFYAVLVKWRSAMPPVGATRARGGEAGRIDISAFAPAEVARGGEALVQLFLHRVDQAARAARQARQADATAGPRGVATLEVTAAVGERIDIVLEAKGAAIDRPAQFVVWQGDPRACQFVLTVPRSLEASALLVRAFAFVKGKADPVGSLLFRLPVVAAAQPVAALDIVGEAAPSYVRPFLSYSSRDRAEVLKRVDILKALRIGFFLDLLSLRPGQRWERRIYREIDNCDVFVLFWSSNAQKSKWVAIETERALARRGGDETAPPDIVPIVLEGPPPPRPPDHWKGIHFNDWLPYVRAAVEAQPPRDA